MNEKRQNMLDQIIRKYGFEHKKTVIFANLCEYTLEIPIVEEWLEELFNDYMKEVEV